MHKIARRIEALEARVPGHGVQVIIRNFVDPGKPDAPISSAQTCGRTFARDGGEAEDAFLERVLACARDQVPAGRIAVVLTFPAEGNG